MPAQATQSSNPPPPPGYTLDSAPAPPAGYTLDSAQPSAPPAAPKPEGFWHSVGSVFGLTPESAQAAGKETAAHPFKTAIENSFPLVGLLKNTAATAPGLAKKAYAESQQSNEALNRGDLSTALMHEIGGAGYLGSTALSPLLGDAPAKAGEQFGSGNVKGGLGTTAALTLPFLTKGAASKISDVIPTKAKAGALFNEAKGAAGDIPIDLSAPGNTALKIQELSQSGGSMPKVIRDFIRRTTDPNKQPLTYNEARDFYSNASRISADEAQRLTPVMKRQLAQFTNDLGQSISGAADQAGVLPQYRGAMKQYRQAAKLEDLKYSMKDNAIKIGLGAAGTGAAAYSLRQMLPFLKQNH